MLNPFPIQFLALFAYFLLRLFVGGCLLFLGIKHLANYRELIQALKLSWWPFTTLSTWLFILVELGAATFTILGFSTQYTMLVVMLMALKMIVVRGWFSTPLLPPRLFYVLLLGTALTLFITGAGALAFDLPI